MATITNRPRSCLSRDYHAMHHATRLPRTYGIYDITHKNCLSFQLDRDPSLQYDKLRWETCRTHMSNRLACTLSATKPLGHSIWPRNLICDIWFECIFIMSLVQTTTNIRNVTMTLYLKTGLFAFTQNIAWLLKLGNRLTVFKKMYLAF